MIIRTAVAALLALTLDVAAAAGGKVDGMLDRARSLLGEGRNAEAVDELEAAIASVWESMRLTLRSVEFVDAVESYGRYTPREGDAFLPNDEIRVYVEPVGYRHLQEGDLYRIKFSADFTLKLKVKSDDSKNGFVEKVILGRDGFVDFSFESRRPNREFYMLITYEFEGLKPGDYSLVTTLHDAGSGKSASFKKALRIVQPDPAGGTKPAP